MEDRTAQAMGTAPLGVDPVVGRDLVGFGQKGVGQTILSPAPCLVRPVQGVLHVQVQTTLWGLATGTAGLAKHGCWGVP